MAANRANARRSTGPRTGAGKRRSSRNAVVHGLTARSALLHGDNEWAFNRLARRTFDELDPVGPIEEQLVAEIINHTWKLRRVPTAEVLLFDEHHRRVARKRQPDEEDEVDVEEFRRFLDISKSFEPAPREKVDLTPAQSLSHMVQSTSWSRGTPDSPVWNLERYAARLERSRGAALRMLLTLQKRRQAREDEEEEEESVDEVNEDAVIGDDDGPSPAAPLEGAPATTSAPAGPPLAVSQTEARDDAAPPPAKPRADFDELSRVAVEASSRDPAGADQPDSSTSTPQNEPNESEATGGAEVTASNEDAVQGSHGLAPGVPGSEPTPEPFPEPAAPVEPSPPFGESPPPAT
jgi:hypothetical protein